MDKKKEILMAVKNTLNSISVCGEENLDKLLGCMKAIGLLIREEGKTDADNHAEEQPDA